MYVSTYGNPRQPISRTGLGMDFTISTPFGNQTISLPVEQITATAVNSAWPAVQKKIAAEMPHLIDVAWPLVDKKLDAEVPRLLDVATKQVLATTWPKQIQPLIRGEVANAIAQGKSVAAKGSVLGLVALLAVVGAGIVYVKSTGH